jgi:hypothetical protein
MAYDTEYRLQFEGRIGPEGRTRTRLSRSTPGCDEAMLWGDFRSKSSACVHGHSHSHSPFTRRPSQKLAIMIASLRAPLAQLASELEGAAVCAFRRAPEWGDGRVPCWVVLINKSAFLQKKRRLPHGRPMLQLWPGQVRRMLVTRPRLTRA